MLSSANLQSYVGSDVLSLTDSNGLSPYQDLDEGADQGNDLSDAEFEQFLNNPPYFPNQWPPGGDADLAILRAREINNQIRAIGHSYHELAKQYVERQTPGRLFTSRKHRIEYANETDRMFDQLGELEGLIKELHEHQPRIVAIQSLARKQTTGTGKRKGMGKKCTKTGLMDLVIEFQYTFFKVVLGRFSKPNRAGVTKQRGQANTRA